MGRRTALRIADELGGVFCAKTKRPSLKEAWSVGLNSPPPKSAQEYPSLVIDACEWPFWATVEKIASQMLALDISDNGR